MLLPVRLWVVVLLQIIVAFMRAQRHAGNAARWKVSRQVGRQAGQPAGRPADK